MNNRQANAIVKMLDAIRTELRASTNATRSLRTTGSFDAWRDDVLPFQAYAEELAQQAHTDLAIDEERPS